MANVIWVSISVVVGFFSFPFGHRLKRVPSVYVGYESIACIRIIIVVKIKICTIRLHACIILLDRRRVPKQSMFETAIESSGAAGTRDARSPDKLKIARTQCWTRLLLLSCLHDVRRGFRISNRAQEA